MTRQGTISEKVKTKGRKLIAKAVSFRHGNPASKMKVIGVTGTKGKTVTSLMIYHILKQSGLKAGCITTLSAKIEDEDLDTGFHVTSPEPWDLPKYLKMMKRKGIEYVVLETTSNGLQQGRFAGIKFDTAVITNIDSDHLDYHVTWENYAEAKFSLINHLKEGGLAVVNADHESGKWIEDRSKSLSDDVYASWFSKDEVQNFSQSFDGMKFRYMDIDFNLNLIGTHFLENAIAAIKVCTRYMGVEHVARAFESFSLPEGRMEVLQKDPYTVIVDFAHTPASMSRTLESIYELKDLDSRIISVFGCAGDRDVSRRQMGKPAAKYSKLVVLAPEDPRHEDPAEINSEIFSHAEEEGAVMIARFSDHEEYESSNIDDILARVGRVISNQDVPVVAFDGKDTQARYDAIDFAIRAATDGDIVFVTGKGHEKSLCFGDIEHDWSDQLATKEILENPMTDDFRK